MRTLVLSDLHLGDGGDFDIFAGEEELCSLLKELSAEPARVFINGDSIDFLLDEQPLDGLDPRRAEEHTRRVIGHCRQIFAALGQIVGKGGEIVFRLGNHDIELALDGVQRLIRESVIAGIDGDTREAVRRVQFQRGDWPGFVDMGDTTVLLTHGEHTDRFNRIAYRHLPWPGSAVAGDFRKFKYPAGTKLVKKGLNPLKKEGIRFADLLKPDFEGGLLALGAVAPKSLARVLNESGLSVAWRLALAADQPFAEIASADITVEGNEVSADEIEALRTAVEESAEPEPSLLARAHAWALNSYASLHATVAGTEGQRFFQLNPSDAEWKEALRLRDKFGVSAIIQGHTHAARWREEDGFVYANTGTWIPLVELPTPLKAGGQVEEWTAFLQELRQDPGLMKSKRLKTVFTAVLIEPEGAQARLSLVEWKEGRLQIMKLPVGGEERLCTALTRKSNAKLRTSSARKSVVERVRAILPLLSYYDSGEAVLAEGVAPEMASSQPESPTLYTQRAEGDFLRDRRGDQNALDGQGYGVVVKQGTWDRYRGLLEELLKHREQQAGGFMVFQVETEAVASVARAREWVRGEYLGLSEERQPAYLLILGDLDEVPLPLQQALSAEAYVGRLAFTGPDGKSDERAYEEYARKVVAWEKRPAPAQRARALFYSVDDGTAAVEAGNAALVVPGYRSFLEGHEGDDSGRFENVERLGEDSWCSGPEQLLYDPAIAEPAILMTLSHGCGSPRGGWKGDSNLPRSLQGAMSFGGGIYLTASEMRHQTFIPGGIWFFMACFSAGTPAESNYESWLQHLRTKKIEVKDVLAGLAKRPFIAALPQAVLANPAGPQAVIGHMDLAWTFGLRESTDGRALHYRHRRITDVLKILGTEPRKRSGVWGSTLGGPGRVGPAFSELARSVSRFDKELAEHRAASARAGDYAAVDGELWMGRQDLNDYVLLGDPAVHLPLKRPEPREPSVSAILGFAPNQPSESGTAVTEELEERLWVALPHIDAYRKGGLEALRHAGFDNPEAVEAEILTMVRNLGAQATLGKLDRAKAIYRQGGFAALEKD